MNPKTLRVVKLPDDRIALEIEIISYGGSETYTYYEYFYDGEQITTKGFETDYWGRIEPIEVLDKGVDLTDTYKAISKELQ